MKGEIDNDFYCSAGANIQSVYGIGMDCYLENGNGLSFNAGLCRKERCPHYHRKHPTPEQFKEEYGEDVPDYMPVWFAHLGDTTEDWNLSQYRHFEKEHRANYYLVCACTPFPKPDDNWRPQ